MLTATDERCLILASQSPRRRDLLAKAGWAVQVIPALVDESWPPCSSMEEGACVLALRKARAVSRDHAHCPVLAADTVVCLGDVPMGKPASRTEARQFLLKLSGVTHDVITGVALVLDHESWTAHERSQVTFRTLSPADIDSYLESADYADKAGAYGIQEHGGRLVADFQGRFDNIVGLPLSKVEWLWNQMRNRGDGLR